MLSEIQGVLVPDTPTKPSLPGRRHSQERVGEEAGAGLALHAFLTPQHRLLTSGLIGRERQGPGTQRHRADGWLCLISLCSAHSEIIFKHPYTLIVLLNILKVQSFQKIKQNPVHFSQSLL